MDFCASGVLGGDENDAPIHRGFELELVVRVAPKELRDKFRDLFPDRPMERDDIDCAPFTALRANGTNQRLTFPITAATHDTLTLGDAEDVPEGFDRDNVVEAARYCVADMRFDFRVRSRERYTVRGARSGYLHRVLRDGAGVCVLDTAADEARQGQAIAGVPFSNGRIAFQIGALASDVEPMQDLQFHFPVAAAVSFVEVDTDVADPTGVARTITSEIRYSTIDAQLYAVDSHVRGLLPISLSPLPLGSPTASAFR
jgi:hypothetical protein